MRGDISNGDYRILHGRGTAHRSSRTVVAQRAVPIGATYRPKRRWSQPLRTVRLGSIWYGDFPHTGTLSSDTTRRMACSRRMPARTSLCPAGHAGRHCMSWVFVTRTRVRAVVLFLSSSVAALASVNRNSA